MSCKKAPPSFTVKKKKNQFCYILHLSGKKKKKTFKMNAMGKDFSHNNRTTAAR